MKHYSNYINALFGIFVIIGIFTFARPCISDKAMHCSMSANIVKICMLAIVVINIVCVLFKDKVRPAYWYIITIIISAGTLLLLEYVLPLCMKGDMRCHTHFKPFASIACIVYVIYNIVSLLFDKSKGNEGKL